MSFGKRPSTQQQTLAPPHVDPHGRRKVFPDDVWQGQTGELLRTLGMSPDDESNLVPNASSINAGIDASRRAHETAHAEAQQRVESVLPGARLRPFFLVPDPIWNSPAGVFLMTSLELFPYDAWNVIYLAADERTSAVLDIAIHPNGDIPTFVEASRRFMIDAQAQMKRAHDEAGQTHEFGKYQEAREDVRERVKALAAAFSQTLIEAWEKNGPRRGGRA
ncbi:MAG: hypothetical protein AB7O98_10765 [Hyphomonadaceae bacterium]